MKEEQEQEQEEEQEEEDLQRRKLVTDNALMWPENIQTQILEVKRIPILLKQWLLYKSKTTPSSNFLMKGKTRETRVKENWIT